MDTKTIEAGIQQIDPFQLLDRVNTFYNDAWNRLLILITLALFIIGVVVPYLIQRYQRRFFKVEEDKLREDVKKDLIGAIDDKFKELSIAVDKKFELSNKENEKKVAATEAKIFHVQASQTALNENYDLAIGSYLDTIRPYLICGDELNFRRALEALKGCLSQANSKDMEKIREEGYNIDATLTTIAEKYKGGRYRDLILEIKKEIKTANAKKKE